MHLVSLTSGEQSALLLVLGTWHLLKPGSRVTGCSDFTSCRGIQADAVASVSQIPVAVGVAHKNT